MFEHEVLLTGVILGREVLLIGVVILEHESEVVLIEGVVFNCGHKVLLF